MTDDSRRDYVAFNVGHPQTRAHYYDHPGRHEDIARIFAMNNVWLLTDAANAELHASVGVVEMAPGAEIKAFKLRLELTSEADEVST